MFLASYDPSLLLYSKYEPEALRPWSKPVNPFQENRPIQSRVRNQIAAGLYFETTLIWRRFRTSGTPGNLSPTVVLDTRRYFAMGSTYMKSETNYSINVVGKTVSSVSTKSWSSYNYTDPSRAFVRFFEVWERAVRGSDMLIINNTLACRYAVSSEPLFVPIGDTDVKREKNGENIAYIAASGMNMWREMAPRVGLAPVPNGKHPDSFSLNLEDRSIVSRVNRTFESTVFWNPALSTADTFIDHAKNGKRELYMPVTDGPTTIAIKKSV